MAPLISQYARTKKLEYFFGFLDKDARILDVGCADGWVGAYAQANGWNNIVGIDELQPPAPLGYPFVHGDINRFEEAGIEPESFDALVAFEVIEHGDFYKSLHGMLRPGGYLMVTTPVPSLDWLCKILEGIGLNERRSSPHTHLIKLTDLPDFFAPVEIQTKGLMSQWGVFKKV